MTVWAIRRGKPGYGEHCRLVFEPDSLLLVSADGRPWVRWTPEQLSQAVTFPSFSRSLKHPVFAIAGYGSVPFEINREGLAALRRFADRGVVAGGTRALGRLLIESIVTVVVGAVVFAIGFAPIAMFLESSERPGSFASHVSAHSVALALLGFAVACRGISMLARHFRLRRRRAGTG